VVHRVICAGLDLKYWDFIKDDIELALKHDGGRVNIDDMYKFIVNKDVQLWAIHDGDIHAVMTTQIINYPQLKVVNIFTVTGKQAETWLDLLIETVTAWAKQQGCTAMEFTGRKGWEKLLNKKGFGNTQITMTKPF